MSFSIIRLFLFRRFKIQIVLVQIRVIIFLGIVNDDPSTIKAISKLSSEGQEF